MDYGGGGGGKIPGRNDGGRTAGENGWRWRSRSQRDIGSGKPSEGTRVSGQAIGGVYVQTVS